MKSSNQYTTGEVARLTQLSQQTIIRCFDKGLLKGHRVPGSRFRRVTHDALLEFMRDNDLATSQIDSQVVPQIPHEKSAPSESAATHMIGQILAIIGECLQSKGQPLELSDLEALQIEIRRRLEGSAGDGFVDRSVPE